MPSKSGKLVSAYRRLMASWGFPPSLLFIQRTERTTVICSTLAEEKWILVDSGISTDLILTPSILKLLNLYFKYQVQLLKLSNTLNSKVFTSNIF